MDLYDYQRMVLTWILLVESIASVIWQLFENNQFILLLTLFLHVVAFWLLSKNLCLAGLAWFAAYSSVTAISIILYAAPLVAFLLCLPPLIVVMVFGYFPGVAAGAAVSGLMIIVNTVFPSINGLSGVSPVVIGGSAATLVVGGILRYWFMDTIRYFYSHYQFASQEIESAREKRVENIQIQEDLVFANRELARLARQLKVANQAADEARRAKETFVATVSHELRTPLNMIIGFSEVIAQSPHVYGASLSPTLLADIASIQRNSQHLLELVNDVLDLSQVDMGNLSISRSRCQVETIIDEAFEVIRPLFSSKGLYLRAEIQPNIGEIECDQTRIREVMINLMSNAGRFTEKGGVSVKVWIADEQFYFSVRDTGPGISPADQERLFEPFQQLDDSIRRKQGGSGLGLAISKRFVEMHGGMMWLESALCEGTTFYFRLPVRMGESMETGGASRWVNPIAAIDARTRSFRAPVADLVPRCVVLEKGELAAHLFRRYLGKVEIISVDSVGAALDYLGKCPSHVLVVNHPDAFDVVEQLKASGRLPFNLPIISFWLPGSTDMALSMHAKSYLIKPVSQASLMQVITQDGMNVKTILLVDDNPEILQLFGRIISSADRKYSVLRALDGEQALAMLRRRRPDLMILDLVMPGISGFDVLAEKEADPLIRDIPTVIISAQDPAGVQKIDGEIILARQGGFSPKELLEIIRASGFLGSE